MAAPDARMARPQTRPASSNLIESRGTRPGGIAGISNMIIGSRGLAPRAVLGRGLVRVLGQVLVRVPAQAPGRDLGQVLDLGQAQGWIQVRGPLLARGRLPRVRGRVSIARKGGIAPRTNMRTNAMKGARIALQGRFQIPRARLNTILP